MSDEAAGWVAEGIEWAERVGGVVLEVYIRPGFTGGQKAVRPSTAGGGSAFETTDDGGMWWIEATGRGSVQSK